MVKVAPSLLSANFANLQKDIEAVKQAGASWLHYDVMDGHFVPNISFGYSILSDVKKVTDLYLDVHLMISDPAFYVDNFINAGASLIVFHVEAVEEDQKIIDILNHCKEKGVDVGLSIKPNTPVDALQPFFALVDVVLVMSVEPGFGGQKFNSNAVEKIADLAKRRELKNYSYLIEVDGGINGDTAKLCKDAGVDILVAGSYIFNAEDYQEAIASLL